MGKIVKISEMLSNKEFEDYSEDTIFVLDESDDENWEEEETVKFKLEKEQIEYLKGEYPDNALVQSVLSTEKDGTFEVDEEPYIDFMDYIEDESVAWMDENYDATPKTIMLESIRDDIYYQTN